MEMGNFTEVKMLDLFKNADFWYSLAVVLFAVVALFGAKYRLKKYIHGQSEEGKGEDD